MKEVVEELAREQARLQAEKRVRERLGIPENNFANALEPLIYQIGHSKELFSKIKGLVKQMPREPRVKVSPYAKFDKYHKKRK